MILNQLTNKFLLFCVVLSFLFAACNTSQNRGMKSGKTTLTLTQQEDKSSTLTQIITATTSKPLAAATATPSSSFSPTVTSTSTKTPIPTAAITPTYIILRGKVLVRSNCRYGPGAPYLYKYGLVPGSNLEIIGRNDAGSWILVRAIGGNNPCWVKSTLMDVNGDVMQVAPTYIPLPRSPYYPPLWGVSTVRTDNIVTVTWHAVQLRAGDETASPPYLIEAWVCRNEELVFIPVGAYQNIVEIEDQAGCSKASHARLFLVEKHGYTRAVEIPWQQWRDNFQEITK